MVTVRRRSRRWLSGIAPAVLAGIFLAGYGSVSRELGRSGTDSAAAAVADGHPVLFGQASDLTLAGADTGVRRPPPTHGMAWVPHDRVDTVPTAPFRRAAVHDTGGGPAAGLLHGPDLPGPVTSSPAGVLKG